MDGKAQGAPQSNPDRLPIEARRHAVVTQVARALAGPCRVPHGFTIVLGVSGGADSTALLLAVVALRHRSERYQPIVVHVNHALRVDAGEDERFVEALADRFNLPFRSVTVQPGKEPGNTLANARRLRYAALADIALEEGAPAIATAHHADDQFETMLMALSRGAGLARLRGMRRRRRLHANTALVRPLLTVRKEQLVDLCRTAGVNWRDDPSNRDRSKARARLREEVMPVLESLWPGAATRAAATSESLAFAARLLQRTVRRTFGSKGLTVWQRADLASLPPVLLESGLRTAVREQSTEVNGWSPTADAVPRRVWSQVADAIADNHQHERRFVVGRHGEIRVDAVTVQLLSRSAETTPDIETPAD